MVEHSKGPWWLSDKQPDAVLTADPSASEGLRYAEDNFQYYGGHLVAESIAPQNRPLIAAAPELLDALEVLVEKYGEIKYDEALVKKVEALIAKAKGQNPA